MADNLPEFACLNDELGYLKSILDDPDQNLKVTTLNLTQIEIKLRKSLRLLIVLQESSYPSISPSQVKLKALDIAVLKSGRQQVVEEFLKQTNLALNELVDSNKYKLCVFKVYEKAVEVLSEVKKTNFFLSETLNQLEYGKAGDQKTIKSPDNSTRISKITAQNNEEENETSAKDGAKFKGSDFIFQRMKWDANIDKDQITIGYLDRFLGVKEIKFNDFKGVHEDKEGVPLHRIRYFKVNGTIVWDREQRIDLITG
jgi:uncharacterized protein (UPF0248 family)